ncbi:MAG: hypothetical protein ACFB9M_10575 [Myxococcota bacterium]
MVFRIFGALCFIFTLTTSALACPTSVFVNRHCLQPNAYSALSRILGAPVPPGAYWYDARARLYGPMGGPTQGQLPMAMDLPGPMPADASEGRSGVFVNGRQVTYEEAQVVGLAAQPGRYRMGPDGSIRPAGSSAQPATNPAPKARSRGCESQIRVNGRCLRRQTLAKLGFSQTPPGDYWYDARAGIAGRMGGPVLAQVPPNLPLPGPMPANASNGTSGIFVNGRALHPQEVEMLTSAYGFIRPGRYWLNADGNAGLEGSPEVLVNLLRTAAAAKSGGSSWNYSSGLGTSSSFIAGGGPGCIYASTKSSSVYVGCD